MLGFLVLGLTSFMIFTLVKNALTGTQLRSDETYMGTVELIIPITHRSEFYLEPWLKSLHSFRSLQDRLKIHLLIDGHHPAMTAWEELQHKLPFVELHSFAMRPESSYPVPWMIQQISSQISSPVVIIGDAELVAEEAAFIALARLVSEKKKPYFVLPQTNKRKLLGESVAVLNPTLSLASVSALRSTAAISLILLSVLPRAGSVCPLKASRPLRLESPLFHPGSRPLLDNGSEKKSIMISLLGKDT